MFATRIKELRAQAGYTQKQVADVLGLSDRAYQHYELGTRKPDYDGLMQLADLFKISLDYLTGRSDIKEFTPRQS